MRATHVAPDSPTPLGRMSRLRSLAINADGFAFDPTTGDSFVLNPTGLLILNGLRDDLDADAIAARVAERFEVSADEAARDVTDFLDTLRTFRLL